MPYHKSVVWLIKNAAALLSRGLPANCPVWLQDVLEALLMVYFGPATQEFITHNLRHIYLTIKNAEHSLFLSGFNGLKPFVIQLLTDMSPGSA